MLALELTDKDTAYLTLVEKTLSEIYGLELFLSPFLENEEGYIIESLQECFQIKFIHDSENLAYPIYNFDLDEGGFRCYGLNLVQKLIETTNVQPSTIAPHFPNSYSGQAF